jgi:hypothetical protein
MSTEAGRNELFGGARERQQQQQQSGGYNSQPSGAYGQSGAYGGTGEQPGGYGAYDQRELTAEEQEEEDSTSLPGVCWHRFAKCSLNCFSEDLLTASSLINPL